jgi:hypothetical protein
VALDSPEDRADRVVARLAGEWQRDRHCVRVAGGIGWTLYDLMASSDGSTPLLEAVVLQSETVLRRGEIVTLHRNRESDPFSVYGLARDECERFGIGFACATGRDFDVWTVLTPHRKGLPEITYVRAAGDRLLERYSPPPPGGVGL